jgi:hypothetical protein
MVKKIVSEPDSDRLAGLYSILGQILDGIWFLETEKRLGFEKALEIDLAVWEDFAVRETKRIISALLNTREYSAPVSIDLTFNLLEKILRITLFDQSVGYEIIRGDHEHSLTFQVRQCKTLRGMKKVGRPMDQAQRICKDIGLAYYRNMAKTLQPDLKAECLAVPESYTFNEASPLCAWKFYFSK